MPIGIVQSVPMNKAGVGSAVNDSSREVGGAIGIAVVGSIVTGIYRDHLSPSLVALPADVADLARDNVAKALGVADRAVDIVGPDVADQLRTAVRQAFVDGAHVGLRVSAGLVAAAAVVVCNARQDQQDPAGRFAARPSQASATAKDRTDRG